MLDCPLWTLPDILFCCFVFCCGEDIEEIFHIPCNYHLVVFVMFIFVCIASSIQQLYQRIVFQLLFHSLLTFLREQVLWHDIRAGYQIVLSEVLS